MSSVFGIVSLLTFIGIICAATNDTYSESRYLLRGTVQAVDFDSSELKIAHEAIPGYMEAMTMRFAVRDRNILRAIQVGAKIEARLVTTADDSWLQDVTVVGGSRVDSSIAPTVSLSSGDLVPDLVMLDQSGRARTLSEFHGSTVVLSFFYARCPLPTYCPLINRKLVEAQSFLRKLEPHERKWIFLSVSLDPAHDSPELLANYAKSYSVDPAQWIFASAAQDALTRFAPAIGLDFQITPAGIDHNLRTVVIDRNGKLRRIFTGNRWTPQELTAEVRKATR